jgi:hypothetical protein
MENFESGFHAVAEQQRGIESMIDRVESDIQSAIQLRSESHISRFEAVVHEYVYTKALKPTL